MSWFYRHAIRPILFAQEPEEIHEWTIKGLSWASRHDITRDALASFYGAPALPSRVFDLHFPNPVGLAAGMDKMGAAVPIWPSLGFGHAELGAVTWQAQPGNPPPRIFRAIPAEAIINRMGFNNDGAPALAERLAYWRASGRWPQHPVGINLGKTRVTPLENAPQDYASSLRVLWPYADFFVVNVSSPNTPNLRQLQEKSALDAILQALQETALQCASAAPGTVSPALKPVLVKVAPDLSWEALDEILELVGPRKIAGLVATNTTIERPATDDAELTRVYSEKGGLSGRPLRARSTEIIRYLYRQTRGALPIIGVGGIFDADDAWEKITAGASLLQIYTSMVFQGPGTARDIVIGLIRRLEAAGCKDLHQAVGTGQEGK